MERNCKYDKCNKDITDMRINAKYCSRACKTNKRKMDKYWELRRKEGIESDLALVESIKNFRNIMEINKREE